MSTFEYPTSHFWNFSITGIKLSEMLYASNVALVVQSLEVSDEELLYCRLANDLALWEPQAPRPKETFDLNLASLDKDVSLHPLHLHTDATFYSCTVTTYGT